MISFHLISSQLMRQQLDIMGTIVWVLISKRLKQSDECEPL